MKIRSSFLLALSIFAYVVAVPASASATTFELGGTFVIDANAGADKLLLLQYTDGTNQDIRAGNGLILSGGLGAIFFEGGQHHLETLLNVGVKYSTMQPADNASLDFVRIPVELLALYRNDAFHFRIGAGPALYAFNSLSGSGALPVDVHFDPALGAVLQADFIWGGFFVGLRYTRLSLSPAHQDVSFSANSIGLDIGFFHHFADTSARAE